MITRVTFFHSTLYPTGVVVNTPLGWKDIVISLKRDKKLWSISEYFKSNFFWYGTAHDVINEINEQYGPATTLRVLFEDFVNGSFETLFDGSGSLSEVEDIPKGDIFYKTAMPIIKDSFWVKFINHFDTQVNLSGSLDIYGNVRTVIPAINHPMPSQLIRHTYREEFINDTDDFPDQGYYMFDSSPDIPIGVISFPKVIRNNIETVFQYGANAFEGELLEMYDISNTLIYSYYRPFESFIAQYKGTYTFTIKIVLSSSSRPDLLITTGFYRDDFALRYAKNDELFDGVAYTKTNFGTDGVNGYTVYDLVVSNVAMEAGDAFRYWIYSGITEFAAIVIGTSTLPTSFVEITGDSLFPDSTTDGYLVKDAAKAIISKITGVDNVVDSPLLDTSYGLLGWYKGKHIRGFNVATYPMFASLKDWHDCFDPLLCLGIGKVYGENKIEIDTRESFFNPIPSIVFDKVITLTRKWDKDLFLKSIKVGFNKIGTDVEDGFDDPQGTHTYSVPLPDFGEPLEILSKAIAGSTAIEQLRRAKIKSSDSYSLDEDFIIISLVVDGSSYLPEFGSVFAAITNFTNSDFKINARLTPARLFKRFQNWLQGFMQFPSSGTTFKFSSGEGNILMTSQFEPTDYEAVSSPDVVLTENANIAVTGDFSFTPRLYEGKIPITLEEYQTISIMPKNCIGVKNEQGGYRLLYIDTLDYHRYKGYADISCWLLNSNASIEFLRLLEDGHYRLLENGNYRLLENA